MGLNLKALKAVQEDLNTRGSGDLMFFANEIDGETDVRLLPPLPKQNGLYFIEQRGYWIKGKFYLSPETFDEDCPIAEEIDDAKSYNDEDINELLNSRDIQKKSQFLIPLLLLDCKFDKNGEAISEKVVDNKGKVLVCGSMLMKAINKIVVSRNYQNGTEDGIMDRVKGYNIILDKTGKKLDTEYTAMGWNYSTEMDEKFYTDAAIPDILKMTEESLKPNKYLKAVIRNYLYGEKMPKEEQDDDRETSKGKPSSRSKRRDDDDDDDERPARRGGRSNRDDDDDDKPRNRRSSRDEDDEDERPRRSSRSREDDDDDYDRSRRNSRSRHDDDEEEKPRRGRSKADDDDEEEKPRRNSRREDDDEDEKPQRRGAAKEDDGDDDDEDEKASRSSAKKDIDEAVVVEDKPKRTPAKRGAAKTKTEAEEKPETVNEVEEDVTKPKRRNILSDLDNQD